MPTNFFHSNLINFCNINHITHIQRAKYNSNNSNFCKMLEYSGSRCEAINLINVNTKENGARDGIIYFHAVVRHNLSVTGGELARQMSSFDRRRRASRRRVQRLRAYFILSFCRASFFFPSFLSFRFFSSAFADASNLADALRRREIWKMTYRGRLSRRMRSRDDRWSLPRTGNSTALYV